MKKKLYWKSSKFRVGSIKIKSKRVKDILKYSKLIITPSLEIKKDKDGKTKDIKIKHIGVEPYHDKVF